MAIWEVISKGLFSKKKYVSIDGLTAYLDRQKGNVQFLETKKFIEHLERELKNARAS